jgi:hypothetical protein
VKENDDSEPNALLLLKIRQHNLQAIANIVETGPIRGLFIPTIAHESRVRRVGMRFGNGRSHPIADDAYNNLSQQ